MECHEVADLFPAMTDDEFRELVANIRENGQLDPIVIHERRIVDGRHRHRACVELGIEPKFQEWNGEGGTLLRFVVARNLHRRHLTASQRAALAADLKPRIDNDIRERLKTKASEAGKQGGRGKKKAESEKGFGKNSKTLSGSPRDARSEAAALLKVNPRYVSDAERIKTESPEIFQEIKDGKTTISEAKRKLAQSEPKVERQPETAQLDVEQLWSSVASTPEKWPGDKLAVLAKKLIALGIETLGKASQCDPDAPKSKTPSRPKGSDFEEALDECKSRKERSELIRVITDFHRGDPYWRGRLHESEAKTTWKSPKNPHAGSRSSDDQAKSSPPGKQVAEKPKRLSREEMQELGDARYARAAVEMEKMRLKMEAEKAKAKSNGGGSK